MYMYTYMFLRMYMHNQMHMYGYEWVCTGWVGQCVELVNKALGGDQVDGLFLCPSRQTPCFRGRYSHVFASVSAAPRFLRLQLCSEHMLTIKLPQLQCRNCTFDLH